MPTSCPKWNELPFEILQRIFASFPIISLDPISLLTSIRDFHQCQLVCKGWSHAAQEALYENIVFFKNETALMDTLKEQLPPVSMIVKHLTVASEITLQVAEAIFELCPHIVSISTYSGTNKVIFPYLASDKNQVRGLQRISTDYWNRDSCELYYSIVLKHKNTITELNLSETMHPVIIRPLTEVQKQLKLNLHAFASLKLLMLDHLICFDKEVEWLFDNCPTTVQEMWFTGGSEWGKNNTSFLQNKTKPNRTLKKLNLDFDAEISECMLQYLHIKFPALEHLYINEIHCGNTTEWWKHLANLCSPLKTYEINFNTPGSNDVDPDHIIQCINLAAKSASTNRIIILDGSNDESWYYNQTVLMMQKEINSFELAIYYDMLYKINTQSFLESLQLYSPNELYMFMPYDPHTFGPELIPHKCRPGNNTNGLGTVYLPFEEINKSSGSHNLLSFNDTLSIMNGSKKLNLSIENMIDFDETPFLNYHVAELDELAISNSVLEQSLFPKISCRIAYINLLLFNQCSILMNKPYQWNIFFPFTKINTIRLTGPPFTSDVDDNTDAKRKSCFVNLDLIEALSPNGRYTLRIETNAKTHILDRQGDKTINSNGSDISSGTKHHFLIWITCQDLKKLFIAHSCNLLDSSDS